MWASPDQSNPPTAVLWLGTKGPRALAQQPLDGEAFQGLPSLPHPQSLASRSQNQPWDIQRGGERGVASQNSGLPWSFPKTPHYAELAPKMRQSRGENQKLWSSALVEWLSYEKLPLVESLKYTGMEFITTTPHGRWGSRGLGIDPELTKLWSWNAYPCWLWISRVWTVLQSIFTTVSLPPHPLAHQVPKCPTGSEA